jgi:hypothetical protein
MATTLTARRLLLLMLSMMTAAALMLFGATSVAFAQEDDGDTDTEDVDDDGVEDDGVEDDADDQVDEPEGGVEAGAGGTSDGAPLLPLALGAALIALTGAFFVTRRMATTS